MLMLCDAGFRHVPDVGNGRSAQNVFQYRSSRRYLSYVSFVTFSSMGVGSIMNNVLRHFQ